MPDLYDEYIKAISTNITLKTLDSSGRLELYCLLMAKDYAGVYSFLKERIPLLYEEVLSKVRQNFSGG